MRLLCLLALVLAACTEAEAPPPSAGTGNPAVTTPAETPPSLAVDDTSALPDQPLRYDEGR